MIVLKEGICKYCGEGFYLTRSDKEYCSASCGSRFRSEKWKKLNKEKDLWGRKEYNKRRRSTPYGKYLDQKCGAKGRGIEFRLSFKEWWGLWEPYWEERGVGGMVMCRTNDTGPYELGNVRIDTHANNNVEACISGGRSNSF